MIRGMVIKRRCARVVGNAISAYGRGNFTPLTKTVRGRKARVNCPYGGRMVVNDDYSVKMIGHDDGRIDGDTREAGRKVVPGVPNDGAEGIAFHFTVIDGAKERVALPGATSEIILTGVGITGGWMAQ